MEEHIKPRPINKERVDRIEREKEKESMSMLKRIRQLHHEYYVRHGFRPSYLICSCDTYYKIKATAECMMGVNTLSSINEVAGMKLAIVPNESGDYMVAAGSKEI